MSGGESKFWRNDLKVAFESMGDVDRIESHDVTLGRPDTNLCLHGGIVWDIELKYCDSNKVKLRPSQRMWLRKRAGVGGKVAVFSKVVSKDGTFFMLHIGPAVARVSDDLEDWIKTATHIWDHKIDFAELEEMLRG
jgi:hypothetical protein